MQHIDRAGGIEHMEIDHFDSTQKGDYHQQYDNLFLAKGACNRKKQDRPRRAEAKSGLRFLNCCKEIDYNGVIFEDPDTHEVWGATPEAKYHIRYLGLNTRNLVDERRERSELETILHRSFLRKKAPDKKMIGLIQLLVETLQKHIPIIELRRKPLPASACPPIADMRAPTTVQRKDIFSD